MALRQFIRHTKQKEAKKWYESNLTVQSEFVFRIQPKNDEVINTDYYCKLLNHQGNLLLPTVKKLLTKVSELGHELLQHPPYSIDLLPRKSQNILSSKQFLSNKDAIVSVEGYFEGYYRHYEVSLQLVQESHLKVIPQSFFYYPL